MRKIIILIMVLVVRVFAQENIEVPNVTKQNEQISSNSLSTEIVISAKALVKNGNGKARVYLQKKGIKFSNYRRNDYSSSFISNVTASIGKSRVLDASFNHYLWLPPTIDFKFKDLSSDAKNIIYTIKDNHGKSVKKSFKIKRKGTSSTQNMKQITKETFINPKAWEATNIDDAIKALYGEDAFKKIEKTSKTNFLKKKQFNNISCLPKEVCSLAINGYMEIILEIDQELDSIAIFSTTTNKALLAVFKISKKNKTYVSTKYSLKKFGKIFVIARMRDGKLYKSEFYEVSPTGHTESGASRTLGFSSK